MAPDANVTVAESTIVVQAHPDGSATWTVRNRLSSGAAAFREAPDRLDRTARALEGRRGLLERERNVSARLAGDTVVITAAQPEAARRQAGLLVVEFLQERGSEPRHVVNADRFSVRVPQGRS